MRASAPRLLSAVSSLNLRRSKDNKASVKSTHSLNSSQESATDLTSLSRLERHRRFYNSFENSNADEPFYKKHDPQWQNPHDRAPKPTRSEKVRKKIKQSVVSSHLNMRPRKSFSLGVFSGLLSGGVLMVSVATAYPPVQEYKDAHDLSRFQYLSGNPANEIMIASTLDTAYKTSEQSLSLTGNSIKSLTVKTVNDDFAKRKIDIVSTVSVDQSASAEKIAIPETYQSNKDTADSRKETTDLQAEFQGIGEAYKQSEDAEVRALDDKSNVKNPEVSRSIEKLALLSVRPSFLKGPEKSTKETNSALHLNDRSSSSDADSVIPPLPSRGAPESKQSHSNKEELKTKTASSKEGFLKAQRSAEKLKSLAKVRKNKAKRRWAKKASAQRSSLGAKRRKKRRVIKSGPQQFVQKHRPAWALNAFGQKK